MELTKELVFAVNLAGSAGAILLERYGQVQTIEPKSRTDFKAAVDDEIDRMMIAAVYAEYPQDGIVTEENDVSKIGTSGRKWIMDPLDGTTNFAYLLGRELFCVSIGIT